MFQQGGAKQNKIRILGSLAFFFCLLASSLAFAASPTVGTISPSSGSTAPNIAKTFTTTYSDSDGYANISQAYLLISVDSNLPANSVYLFYDQNANKLYLRDDANTAWLGGYSPGASNTIENSYVKLNCLSSSVSGSIKTLTVKYNLTFKPAYSGKSYNSYLKVIDDTGNSTLWVRKGSYAINYPPKVGAISPSSGTALVNTPLTFTAAYSDQDGWQNIQYVYFLMNSSVSGLNCPYFYYNQNTNKLYLRDDANTAWLGGYEPGSSNVIENSYAKLDCSLTEVAASGATLTVKWLVVIKPSFTGNKNSYLYVRDDANAYQNYTKVGTEIIPNHPPSVGAVSPSAGASQPDQQTEFIATYTDPDTWLNLQYGYFLVNTSTSGTNCLYAYYNQNTNKLYLRNNANTAWLGGYAPGSNKIIENSYAKLNCAATTVSGLDNMLTVSWQVTFKNTFLGLKNTYLKVTDDANSSNGWLLKGSWSIALDTIPPAGTIKINGDSQYTKSLSIALTLSAEDNPGGSGLAQMQFSTDNINWSSPENYAATKPWALLSGEGEKTVYAKFSDSAGNWSQAASDTITLDTTAPVISLAQVNSPTNQDVALAYTKSDNFTPADELLVTGDNSPYTAEGTHNITLSGSDLAGNTSTAQTSFTIDKTPPVIVITSPKDGETFAAEQITLAGAIDAIPFSETRTLTQEGANTIAKTATDGAGNTSYVSITVYLQRGQLIGPEGGTVISGDGKVKVIIPQGALTESARIKVLNIDQDTLKDNAPQNSSLLSAVECLPYGLIFNQPVSIIYTLTQAEVPGTPVELGLYDALLDRITPTGQTSTVPADGYTLTFSIMHFSTYAALKNLTPQSTPIGLGVKIPLPDLLTGSFSHSIPLTVAPGRKGMQPSLGFNYRSSGSNSWVGLGFNLNPGYIVRSTRLGPPSYNDAQDTFYFIADAGTTELVHLIDNLYQAKVESAFSKFFKEPDDSWKVVTKEGAVLRFGQSPDSKESSPSGTFSWYLTKAADTNGNYLSYVYTKDQGKSYLSRIDYTGNEIGISPANSVTFILEPRDDVSSSYISSAKIATAKRLKEIQVKLGLELVWKYLLEYAYSPDTNRSLLTKITQAGSDGKTLPAQKLKYQEAR